MNHAGEIAPLAAHVRPHVALITTIAPAHIENLGSMEAIADEKAQIFTGLAEGGAAIIPADSDFTPRMIERAEALNVRTITFGRDSTADVRLLDAIPSANGGSLVTAQLRSDAGERRLCYSVAEPGEHWVMNSLGVIAAVHAAGGDLASAGLALAEMGGLKGRGARVRISVTGGRALVIDESYNANPASMRATLQSLGQTPAHRRIAVLGSMKELGDFAPSFHARLAEPLRDAGIDHAILVGAEMRALAEELGRKQGDPLGFAGSFTHCDDAGQAIELIARYGLAHGDAVLVKASNSLQLGRVVSHLAKPSE